MTPLTTGNTAKVYCLNWIENYIQTHGQGVRILDVGSGTSNNFVELIRRYPDVTYVGVEPYASACEKRGTIYKVIMSISSMTLHMTSWGVW